MISVIVYGRNDSYGYNLHKRAALSLNCLAHILCDTEDEILFVDYNTPDDFPTFPEAISDTLTSEVHRKLRILRVRAEVHRRFQAHTHLPVIEAIARNVAVRRSNPNNRWMLSTNTDMIFVCRKEPSLASIVRGLPPGYYHLPRFDIPESLWETFDRFDPVRTISDAKYWGRMAHLNEVVRSQPFFLYDAPGDFQLMERDDIFKIHGFREDMLLGWHVDANISKRLYLLHGKVGDLSQELMGYHCNHMRQATPKHWDTRTDDWAVTVDNLLSPEITSQAETWGCPFDDVEEIALSSCPSDKYRSGIQKVINVPMVTPTKAIYRAESYDRMEYDPRHVLPYLADLFVNCPRDWNIGWLGSTGEMLCLFREMWRVMGFKGTIIVENEPSLEVRSATPYNLQDILTKSDIFVVDLGDVTGKGELDLHLTKYREQVEEFLDKFWALISVERDREIKDRRRVITINSMNGYFERLISNNLSCAKTRISSRLRYGLVVDQTNGPQDWMPDMLAGINGVIVDGGIRTRLGSPGHVAYGPYRTLPPGKYKLSIIMHTQTQINAKDKPIPAPLIIEVANRDLVLARTQLHPEALDHREHAVNFAVNSSALEVEMRLWSSGLVDVILTSVKVEKVHFNA